MAITASARAFKPLLAIMSTDTLRASALSDESSSQVTAEGKDSNCLVLKIHGWDGLDQVAVAGREIGSSKDVPGEEMFVSINQSWRAVWR
jgi:hypothetical protein